MQIEPSYIGVLATVMRERGHDLSSLGPRYTAPLNESDLVQLCDRVVEATRNDLSLGLHVGAAMHIGTHGLFGHALMSCRTLKQAAGILMRHNPLKGGDSRSELTFEGGSAILIFEPPFEVPGRPSLLTDVFFAAAGTAIRELTGTDLIPGTLELSCKPPCEPETYREILRVESVTFGKATNRLIGPASTLDIPLRSSAGVVTADAYLKQCEALLRRMQAASGFESSVRRALLRSRGRFPSAPEVAAILHMSERTLRRRLEAEGTSYQSIVNDVRNHLARQYLADTMLSVAEVGVLIGFEDLANFRQAFRKWNGMTPAQFRVLAIGSSRKSGSGVRQSHTSGTEDAARRKEDPASAGPSSSGVI